MRAKSFILGSNLRSLRGAKGSVGFTCALQKSAFEHVLPVDVLVANLLK